MNEIEEYELSDRIIAIQEEEAKMIPVQEEVLNPNLIDHSAKLHQDFSNFLFNE
jgi:hypothetical protein